MNTQEQSQYFPQQNYQFQECQSIKFNEIFHNASQSFNFNYYFPIPDIQLQQQDSPISIQESTSEITPPKIKMMKNPSENNKNIQIGKLQAEFQFDNNQTVSLDDLVMENTFQNYESLYENENLNALPINQNNNINNNNSNNNNHHMNVHHDSNNHSSDHYISCMEDLVQFQNKKQTLIKKKISKNLKKPKRVQVTDKTIQEKGIKAFRGGKHNIFRNNLKPSTAHLPTLFMNILVPYLLDIYRSYDHFKCQYYFQKKMETNEKFTPNCTCKSCSEYFFIMQFKRGHYNSNISDLNNMWKFPRLRILTEQFLLKKSYHKIINRNVYRSQVTFISFLLSLPLFFKGVQSDAQFYKLL